jgi:hypothetical protein
MKTTWMLAVLFIAEGFSAYFKFDYPEKMWVIAIPGLMLAAFSDIIDIYKKINGDSAE